MEAKKTQKQSDLFKLSFVNVDYTVEGNRTTCEILCKVKLNAWETRYGEFTEKMKRNVLKNYFNTITTITPAKQIGYHKVVNGVGYDGESTVIVGKETSESEITPFFWVQASTEPKDGDVYDEDRGKMISRRKAKRIAYRQMRAFIKDLVRYQMQPMLNSLKGAYNDMDCFADDKVLEEEMAK